MSTRRHFVGVKLPDDQWKRMQAAHDACVAAGVPVPAEVMSFFEHFNQFYGDRAEIDLSERVTKIHEDACVVFEINLRHLPFSLDMIRIEER